MTMCFGNCNFATSPWLSFKMECNIDSIIIHLAEGSLPSNFALYWSETLLSSIRIGAAIYGGITILIIIFRSTWVYYCVCCILSKPEPKPENVAGAPQLPTVIPPPTTATRESIYAPAPAPSPIESGGLHWPKSQGGIMLPPLGSLPASGPAASTAGSVTSGCSSIKPHAASQLTVALYALICLIAGFHLF